MKFDRPRFIRCEARVETAGFPAIGIEILFQQAPLYRRQFQQRGRHGDHCFSSTKEISAAGLLRTSSPLATNKRTISQMSPTGGSTGSRSMMSSGPSSWPTTMKLLLDPVT